MGGTGHYEVLQVTYDTTQVSYEYLLEVYWANADPLDDGGQFCDRGASYKTAIFYHSGEQQQLAEASRQRLSERYELASEIVTPIAYRGFLSGRTLSPGLSSKEPPSLQLLCMELRSA